LWAKLGQADFAERHPVICHLLDVASTALRLWEDVLHDALKKRLAASLGLPPDAAGCWLAFWAGAQDIGKVSPAFQAQRKTGEQKTQLAAGFNFDKPGGKKPQGDISTAVLASELTGGQSLAAGQCVRRPSRGRRGQLCNGLNPTLTTLWTLSCTRNSTCSSNHFYPGGTPVGYRCGLGCGRR
jgi:hypothetical protein